MNALELPVYFCTGARNHDLLEAFNPAMMTFEIDERIVRLFREA